MDILDTVILDNYTVSVTRLCDNVVVLSKTIEGNITDLLLDNILSGGLQYNISIIPTNVLGNGMEIVSNVTLQGIGMLLLLVLLLIITILLLHRSS